MSRKFWYSTLWNWNGHLLCAVDTETSGDIPGYHDILEVAVVPLNSDIQINKEFTPFACTIQPKRVENYLDKATRMNRLRIAEAKVNGIDPWRAADLFDEWFQKLRLAENKRILPLACFWPHDRAFLIDWLGIANFNHTFDVRYRDVQTAALFMNDRSEFELEQQIPHPKTNLQYLCSQYKIERKRPHTALEDAVITAEVYRLMIKESL